MIHAGRILVDEEVLGLRIKEEPRVERLREEEAMPLGIAVEVRSRPEPTQISMVEPVVPSSIIRRIQPTVVAMVYPAASRVMEGAEPTRLEPSLAEFFLGQPLGHYVRYRGRSELGRSHRDRPL